MSSYYTNYFGHIFELKLILRENEFHDFLKRYEELNGINGIEKEINTYYEDAIDEYCFIQSDCAGEYIEDDDVPPRHTFRIMEFPIEESKDMVFIPYMSNGKRNMYWTEWVINLDYVQYKMGAEAVYLIGSDKIVNNLVIYDGENRRFYYMELLDEFKRKMERYLPDDFDWDKHIGRLVYEG